MQIKATDRTWEVIFDESMQLIDDVSSSVGHDFVWSIGGGTVLMFHFDHRFSKDIDIFLDDPQLLGFFSPRLNDAIASKISNYDESATAIKIEGTKGDIDFIVARNVTPLPDIATEIRGIPVRLQHPVEIVAKKIYYRADQPVARDLLDLAVVLQHYSETARLITESSGERIWIFLETVKARPQMIARQFEQLRTIGEPKPLIECLAEIESTFAAFK